MAAPGVTPGVPQPRAAIPATTAAKTAPPAAQGRPDIPSDLANPTARRQFVEGLRVREEKLKAAAWKQAQREGWSPQGESDGRPYELMAIQGGRVYVRTTFNHEAAITTAAAAVRQAPPFDLDGTNVIVGEWDAGSIRATHQEFGGRVIVEDGAAIHSHSTHVGGTLGAAGIVARARGMAPRGTIESYDWDYDSAEMAERGMAADGETNRVQISNHSYGFLAGWSGSGDTWHGTWGDKEADGFGLYDDGAVTLDTVCFATPYLLPFKAAGNDRSDSAPSPGRSFSYYDGGWKTKPYDAATDPPGDNWDHGGYDSIPFEANAKNIMTVGAVNDAVSNGARSPAHASMTSFSSWGPSDDGRVKPDIVANGADLYSTGSAGDQSYANLSGTSMATPSAAGSAALLVQYYGRLFPGRAMPASLLKGLIIHAADDLGNPGPDYQFGWGLMNTHAAAEQIRLHHSRTRALRMTEDTITGNRQTNVYAFVWDNTTPIRVTLCWTDPPGPPRAALDDRSTNLAHDLDLRVVDPDGGVHFPFVLSATNPAAPATTGDNTVDNVEQVAIAAPPARGAYQVIVGLDGDLQTSAQAYSFLISGSGIPPEMEHSPLENTTNSAAPYTVDVRLTCETALNTNRLSVFWNTTGSRRAFLESRLSPVNSDEFQASIPAQPEGSRVYYFVRAEAMNGLATVLPDHSPDTLLSFAVVPPLPLTIAGSPANIGVVSPDYGSASYPSGITVRVSAELFAPPSNGVRSTCLGWTGTGSIPATGQTNDMSFTLDKASVLTWLWGDAYELVQTATVAGWGGTSVWWQAGSSAQTVQAPAQIANGVSNFQFCGWYLDGWQRLPDASHAAANPAGGILMDAPHSVTAVYLPASQDANGDGLADWWGLYYFGTLLVAGELDSDGDGFSNLLEYRDRADPRDSSSVPMPPSIAHAPLGSVQDQPGSRAVAATVTDNDAVQEVRLEWKLNSNGWTGVSMLPAEQANQYTNLIPAPLVAGDHFDYRIVARDRAGLSAVNGPYAVDVRYAVAVLSPTNLGTIQLPSDGFTRTPLIVSNVGNTGLAWTLEGQNCGLKNGAESGTNGWTHGGDNDVWHISTQRVHSGDAAWFFGSEGRGGYPDSAKAWLASPPVYLDEGSVFTYWQWLSTEDLKDATHAWDGGIVEISANDGATYTQIAPVGGYPYVTFGHSASAFPDATPCFAGSGGWQRVTFDLGSYAGQAVRLRFRFGSDGYVVDEGWYIDDLEITPSGGTDRWLTASYSNGVTESQKSRTVFITLHAGNLAPADTWAGVLRFQSNDPVSPLQWVPVRMHSISREIAVTWEGAGRVEPAGHVRVVSGSATNFQITASNYYHIGAILTNRVSAAGPLPTTSTNFVWSNITTAGELRVVFAPNLAMHEVPESWLAGYGLTNESFDTETLRDQDGDGLRAWEEFVAGTDPTNSESVLRLLQLEPWSTNHLMNVYTNENGTMGTQWIMQCEQVIVSWPGVSNRLYTLYEATGLLSSAQAVAGPLPGTPPLNTYTNPADTSESRFYRLGVRIAP